MSLLAYRIQLVLISLCRALGGFGARGRTLGAVILGGRTLGAVILGGRTWGASIPGGRTVAARRIGAPMVAAPGIGAPMVAAPGIVVSAMVVFVLAMSGCPDDTAGDGDAGIKLDGQIRRDARVDAMVGVDASDTCGAEDLIAQALCGMGKKCTLTNGTTTVGCAESGTIAAYDPCEAVFPDECEAWSLCSNASGSYQCLPFCTESGFYCEGGRCGDVQVASEGDFKVYLCLPADNCNPQTLWAGDSGCGLGQACYLTSVGEGLTFCEPEGSTAPGAGCVNDFSCYQGYACFGPPGEGVCRRVCLAEGGSSCPAGQSCTPVDDQYGICF